MFFPPPLALYKHIVALKATIDKQKSTLKIVLKFGGFVFRRRASVCLPKVSKALFTRHKLTRVRPGLKLTRVSFCRVNTANPGSTRVSLEKCRVNTTWVSLCHVNRALRVSKSTEAKQS